jgi:DNA-binding transcriptional regulator YiaG
MDEKKFKEIQKKNKLKNKEVARFLFCSVRTVERYRSGEYKIPDIVAARMKAIDD